MTSGVAVHAVAVANFSVTRETGMKFDGVTEFSGYDHVYRSEVVRAS